MKRLNLLLLALLLGAAASAQSPVSDGEDEKLIRTSLQKWVEDFNNGDFAKTFEIWSPDLAGWYPGSKKDITYADAIKVPNENSPKVTFQLQINEILIDNNIAVVRDTWVQKVKSSKSNDVKSTTLKSFEVWRKQVDGKWKIIRWISYEEPNA